MKIIVTGATGYVGQELMADLKTVNGIEVIGICRTGAPSNCINCDIINLAELVSLFEGADIIVHLAAKTPKNGILYGNEFFDVNVTGTFNVLEAAKRSKVKKVIYASSINAVGDGNSKFPVHEDSICIPVSGAYGVSKYLGEEMCRIYALQNDFDVISLRIGMIWPENQIDIPHNAGSNRWFCHVDINDVIKAIRLSIDKKIKYGVFNIVSQNICSRYDTTRSKEILGFTTGYNFKELLPTKLHKDPLRWINNKIRNLIS